MFIIEEYVNDKWVPLRTEAGKLYQYTDEVLAVAMCGKRPWLRVAETTNAR